MSGFWLWHNLYCMTYRMIVKCQSYRMIVTCQISIIHNDCHMSVTHNNCDIYRMIVACQSYRMILMCQSYRIIVTCQSYRIIVMCKSYRIIVTCQAYRIIVTCQSYMWHVTMTYLHNSDKLVIPVGCVNIPGSVGRVWWAGYREQWKEQRLRQYGSAVIFTSSWHVNRLHDPSQFIITISELNI